MTKDVIIGISGLHFTGDENADSLEMIAPGEYYFKNGKHYIKYEEVLEGYQEKNTNIVKIAPDKLEVTKKGITNVHMVFEQNTKNLACYSTPFGNLMFGIEGGSLSITESEDLIHVQTKYSLDINYEHVADCVIKLDIRPKQVGKFSFTNM